MFTPTQEALNSGANADEVSMSPRVGMLQSMATAYNSTWNNSEADAHFALSDELWQQRSGMLKQNIVMPEIRRKNGEAIDFSDVGRFYDGQDTDLDTTSIEAYDAKINELRSTHPDAKLKTTKEMWDAQKAAAAYSADQEQRRRGTTGGAIGGFFGDFAGQVASGAARLAMPGTDNALVGGATVISTVAGGELLMGAKAGIVPLAGGEAIIQGGAVAANELGGARTFRGALGGDDSYRSSMVNVIEAAGGGAILRGGFGGIAKGTGISKRRWFADMPDDVAPPPPKFDTGSGSAERADFTVGPDGTVRDSRLTPEQQYEMAAERLRQANPDLGRTREGRSRVINDLDDVTSRLDDWENPERPIDLKPRTDTAIPEPVAGVRYADDIDTRSALGRLSVDELARKADPDAFRVYDDLQAKADALRQELQNGKPDTVEWGRMITEANNKVSDITDQLGNRRLKANERAALEAQRDAAMAARDELQATPRSTDTPRQSGLRDNLVKLDQKMRDMAPTISRAYAHARGSYVPDAKLASAVKNMIDTRGGRLADADAKAIVDDAEALFNDPVKRAKNAAPENTARPGSGAAVADSSPVMRRTDTADIEPGKPLVEAARKTIKREAESADDTLTKFRESLGKVLGDGKKKGGKITIGDHEFNLSDELEMPNLDGEGSRKTTVRELLNEIREADENAKAVQTCSI